MPHSFTMHRGALLLLLFYTGLLPFVPLGESLLQFYLLRIMNQCVSVHVECSSMCLYTDMSSLFKSPGVADVLKVNAQVKVQELAQICLHSCLINKVSVSCHASHTLYTDTHVHHNRRFSPCETVSKIISKRSCAIM